MREFLHSQQQSATCAVAAVRTVLHRQFGVRVCEPALTALGTMFGSPIVRMGSDVHNMRRMVRLASQAYNGMRPWTLRVRRNGTLKALSYWVRRGRWPIVQVFVPEMMEHHAIVVIKVEADRVQYFDPDPSMSKRLRWMSKDKFLDWWLSPIDACRWWAVINGGELVQYD